MEKTDITLFMSMKDINQTCKTVIDLADANTAKDFDALAKVFLTTSGAPRYWGFAAYKDKHNQSSLKCNPAVVLEYAFTQRQALIDRITDLGWNALVFNADRAKQATVVVVLPLVNVIIDEKDYTRATTVVADTLGIYDLLDGKSNTFLVQPAARACSVLLHGKPISAYELNRGGWIEFKDWQKPQPASPAPMPAPAPSKGQKIAAQLRVLADLFDSTD